jgi:hypothetical protein
MLVYIYVAKHLFSSIFEISINLLFYQSTQVDHVLRNVIFCKICHNKTLTSVITSKNNKIANSSVWAFLSYFSVSDLQK